MYIEFDALKNANNVRTRDLSFEQAADFDFETAVVQQDLRKDYPVVDDNYRGRLTTTMLAG
jgi:uncharacterized DUF497 family protein